MTEKIMVLTDETTAATLRETIRRLQTEAEAPERTHTMNIETETPIESLSRQMWAARKTIAEDAYPVYAENDKFASALISALINLQDACKAIDDLEDHS